MNKKGVTILELLISITLVSIVILLLIKVIFSLNNINNDKSYASNDEISRTELIKNIESDFLKLKLEGSKFRQDVWNILLTIPYGRVITYGDIAKKLEQKYKRKMSAQAVGGAVGHNPISIIVPCHRVVGTNGNLTGYAGGIDKKIKLLKLENINFEKLFVPKKTQHYKNNKN